MIKLLNLFLLLHKTSRPLVFQSNICPLPFQKTLDYKSKVINFLQVLFCERYVYLKVNFIIQQKDSFEKNLFCFRHDFLKKKCILLERTDFVWEIDN